MHKVAVFAGARGGTELWRDNWNIGWELSENCTHTYYGGSSRGIMGALAGGFTKNRRYLDKASKLTGVLPESIAKLKHYDPAIDLVVTPDMPSRKAVFWQCDAFLCLPGAYGTMDELSEIATHMKLGHEKNRPIAVFNQNGFYDPLKQQLDVMVKFGAMERDRADLIRFFNEPMEAVSHVIRR